jgi:hypothetical protein
VACDFSLQHYDDCMCLVARAIEEADARIELVHDLDLSIEQVELVARCEENYGLAATYFVRLHAANYNALSSRAIGMMRSLLERAPAAHLGLHLEPAFYDQRSSEFLSVVSAALWLLGCVARQEINKVSIHEPARGERLTLENEARLRERGVAVYGYGSTYYEGKKYISDSGARWREGCMCEHIRARLSGEKTGELVILTHPEWWFSKNPAEGY